MGEEGREICIESDAIRPGEKFNERTVGFSCVDTGEPYQILRVRIGYLEATYHSFELQPPEDASRGSWQHPCF
jgi:hypothetical protein